ncbi:hypothetical protein DVH24_022798 [Malus domestica]|uniref:Uncharacterized protein n=1 Tax=Malus domestica TaxID=3750 RepID=A0A498KQC4_MALDO|nr:hypothetical protein DVH24_022798 [Malus domestica]
MLRFDYTSSGIFVPFPLLSLKSWAFPFASGSLHRTPFLSRDFPRTTTYATYPVPIRRKFLKRPSFHGTVFSYGQTNSAQWFQKRLGYHSSSC